MTSDFIKSEATMHVITNEIINHMSIYNLDVNKIYVPKVIDFHSVPLKMNA